MKKHLIKFLTLLITSTLISSTVPNISYVNAYAETRENCNDKYKVNLTTLYPTEDDWNKDYNYVVNTLTPEIENYKGKLNNPESFIKFIDSYNNLYGYLNKLYIYAYVQCDVDQSNNESSLLFSKINSLISDTSLKLSFADAEIYQNDDSFFDNLLADSNYSSYKSVIEAYKEKRVHSLSESENKILNRLSTTSEKPYEIFTKLTSVDMEYPEVNGYVANEANYGIIRTSPDRKFRRDGSEAMFTTYGKYINTLASNLTTHIMNQNNIAQSLGYEDAFDKALKENNIPKEVYNNLIDAAINTADKYSEYFNVNKELLGLKDMYRYDMAASPVTLDKSFSYEEGKKLVLDSLSVLGTDYTDKLKKMIDESRIDVYSGANKVSGAYSISDSMAPALIVMNYDDTYDSVSTLAHELGHSMYSTYSNENQPIQYAEPTIFTQEIASITNELILINNMIKNAETNEEKLYYLNAKLDLYNGTFFTQVQFAQFEKGAYDLVKEKGTLTPNDANKLWKGITKTYDGDVINTPDYYKYGWSRIPHFYYTFYVYQYATSLVCADIISEKLSNGDTEALAAYKNFLKSGSSEQPLELIKKAGVDLTNPDTFKNFSNHYGKLIEEYKTCAGNQ
ncbi:MAG: oligoendopeptidase F [Clostridium sp.]